MAIISESLEFAGDRDSASHAHRIRRVGSASNITCLTFRIESVGAGLAIGAHPAFFAILSESPELALEVATVVAGGVAVFATAVFAAAVFATAVFATAV